MLHLKAHDESLQICGWFAINQFDEFVTKLARDVVNDDVAAVGRL